MALWSFMVKGTKTRQVALSEATVAAIDSYLARRSGGSDYLFVSDGGSGLGYEAIKSLFHRWKKADQTHILSPTFGYRRTR